MRIALDSSVLIAAHISRAGVCAELLEDVLLHHDLVISDFILEELARKLVEKFNFPKRDTDLVGIFLRRVATVVQPADLPRDLCRHPADVPILGTAVGGAHRRSIEFPVSTPRGQPPTSAVNTVND